MKPNLHRRELLLGAAGALVVGTPQAALQRIEEQLFGSPVELLLPPGAPRRTRGEVLRGLAQINRRWNAWKPGELLALNACLREGRVARVTPALAGALRRCAALERASLGHFNPAIGALVAGWGFHADRLADGPAPASADVRRWTDGRPSLAQLEWRGLALRSSNRAVQIDLGGYAKGAALDWALDRLEQQGIGDALLNLGGNLAAMGHAQGGARRWVVGIRDPLRPGLVATIVTRGREAVVTSGHYERWRKASGERVSHLIEPAKGRPAAGLLASVTVVHRDAALADAAATALAVAGPDRWRTVARRMGVDQVLVVHEQGRLEATPQLQPRLMSAA